MDRSKIVTKLIAKGLSIRTIAKKIDLSPNSVKYWVNKLGLKAKYAHNKHGYKPPVHEDSIGKTYGNLLVLYLVKEPIHGSYEAVCRCLLCKKKTIKNLSNMLRGTIKSCGCDRSYYLKVRGKNSTQYTGYGDISGSLWKKIKYAARKRDIIFNITLKQAWKLFLKQNKKCALSGISLKFGRSEKLSETTASLDRIDNKKGYIRNNIQWVLKDVNIMKNIHDQEYFLVLCSKIAKNKPPKKDIPNDSEIFSRGCYRTHS